MTKEIPKDAYAIIIGAMKCGTSSLYSYLENHPEICPAIVKEPEYFSENQRHGVDVENYNDLWGFDNAVHRYALEASTGYTKYPLEPHVPEKIMGHGIRPKFIYIIRNPFERIESHFNYMRKDEAWNLGIVDEHILKTNDYFLQLEQYREYFPVEDILVLDFDELRGNPSQVVRNVYDFLKLSNCYLPGEFKVANRTKVESKIEQNLKSSKLSAVFSYIPRPVKKLGKSLLLRVSTLDKRVLTDAEKEFIYNELRESMVKLQDIYGFDVRKWGFGL